MSERDHSNADATPAEKPPDPEDLSWSLPPPAAREPAAQDSGGAAAAPANPAPEQARTPIGSDAAVERNPRDKPFPRPPKKPGSATILGVAPQSPTQPLAHRPSPMFVRSGESKSDIDLAALGAVPSHEDAPPAPDLPPLPDFSAPADFPAPADHPGPADFPVPAGFPPPPDFLVAEPARAESPERPVLAGVLDAPPSGAVPFAPRSGAVVPDAEFNAAPRAGRAPEPEPSGSDARVAEAGSAHTERSFGEAIRARVKIVGVTLPLWLICALPVALLIALIIAIAGGRSKDEVSLPQVPAVSAVASGTPAVSSAATSEAAPDDAALKALEAKGEASLSAAELLTLADGRRQRDDRDAAAFRARLARDARIGDRDVAAEFRKFLANRDTASDALGAIAGLPGPVGPDILYDVWTGTPQRTDVTELARMLLYSKDQRPKASPALAVALDLRVADTCEQSKDAVKRAKDNGDRRSLPSLAKLLAKSGCGPTKRLDCYPCLRDGDDLKQAIAAVRNRRPPKVPTAP